MLAMEQKRVCASGNGMTNVIAVGAAVCLSLAASFLSQPEGGGVP